MLSRAAGGSPGVLDYPVGPSSVVDRRKGRCLGIRPIVGQPGRARNPVTAPNVIVPSPDAASSSCEGGRSVRAIWMVRRPKAPLTISTR
jgi:hypothetical protein